MTGAERFRLATKIGQTKKLLEEGYSNFEIAAKLGVGESSVRQWVDIIQKAEEKEAELQK